MWSVGKMTGVEDQLLGTHIETSKKTPWQPHCKVQLEIRTYTDPTFLAESFGRRHQVCQVKLQLESYLLTALERI